MHFVTRESLQTITVCNGIATAMEHRVEHATAGDGASTSGRDCFGAPARGIETVCRRGGPKEICSVHAVSSQWGAEEIRVRRRRQRSALASSSTTIVRRHRRGDRLLRAMDDPSDMSADAMLEDTEDLHIASAVAAHLQVLRHWRKRARGSRVSRRPRYFVSVPGRRPNKRRTFRFCLRAILRDYFGLNGEPPVYDEGDFERRFRVPRSVFLWVYNAVNDRTFFYTAH